MLGLLVIDMQKGLFDLGMPHDGDAVVSRIAGLIRRAREADVPVLFVQHDGGPGDEVDSNGPGFPILDALAPLPGESVTVKHYSSAFKDTDLDLKLRALGINKLVVCGMQTEYCVDTTVRSAFERGYSLTIASDAHTTFDGKILPAEKLIAQAHHMWDRRFATLKTAAEITF